MKRDTSKVPRFTLFILKCYSNKWNIFAILYSASLFYLKMLFKHMLELTKNLFFYRLTGSKVWSIP